MIRAALLALLAAPAAAGDLAYVTAQNAGVVAVIDLASGAIRAEVPLPGKPAAVACLPDGRGAAVIEAETGRLSLISPDGAILAARELGSSFGVAVAPDGAIFVTDWDGARLLKLDRRSLAQVWAAPTGPAPTGLAVTPDGAEVLVAERDGDSLGIFAASDGRRRARVPVGAHPFGVTVSGSRAYTADVEGDSVTAVDLANATALGSVPVGARPYAIAFLDGRGYVTNQYDGTLTVFDPGRLTAAGTFTVGESPEGIDVTSDGRLVVANWFSNTLSVLEPGSSAVREIETPDGPRAFGDFVCAGG